MNARMTIFSKTMILLILFLIAFLALYSYSNRISIKVLEKEIQGTSLNRLAFFTDTMDNTIQQLDTFGRSLGKDPDIRQFHEMYLREDLFDLDIIRTKNTIIEKLTLQSNSTNWRNEITIYSPAIGELLSTNNSAVYDKSFINGTGLGWHHTSMTINGITQPVFIWKTVEPFSVEQDLTTADLVVEIVFPFSNLSKLLSDFKANEKRDPFLYMPGYDPILNQSSNSNLTKELLSVLDTENLGSRGFRVVEMAGKEYLVNYSKSVQLGWYVVDYVPLQDILSPITESSRWFYTSILLLLILSVAASYMLYRHVQVPIRNLIRSIRGLRRGDFSVRIPRAEGNEFEFVYQSFNDMAGQIQELIEKVYEEKIRIREAELKQLQSQINPHFLYNCLAFILSMAQMRDHEAVAAMASSLGKYYRYTTRVEKSHTTLGQEIEMVANYLNIQNLRMERIEFTIDVPERLKNMEVPKLLVQPIAENAIIHGIEPVAGEAFIRISVVEINETIQIIVEDNGTGIAEENRAELERKLALPLDDSIGCGMWNVHNRLHVQYGEGSGITFEESELGGLRVVLTIQSINNLHLTGE